jgi:hypothetical protein
MACYIHDLIHSHGESPKERLRCMTLDRDHTAPAVSGDPRQLRLSAPVGGMLVQCPRSLNKSDDWTRVDLDKETTNRSLEEA